MPTLKKRALEEYLRTRFGPEVTLLSFGVIGKASSKGAHKQYGYGTPVKLTYRIGREVRAAVLETMKPGPFGHEHMADRAQAMLWDYESYGRLPRHVKALDVGAFTGRQKLFSVAEGREYFVLNQWTEGASYHEDLERLAKGRSLRTLDRRRTIALARYLAQIHARKKRDADLYRRRLRELIGHGECIMGLTDSYPARFGFITEELLRGIEEACNLWRWRLRGKSKRLSQWACFKRGRRRPPFQPKPILPAAVSGAWRRPLKRSTVCSRPFPVTWMAPWPIRPMNKSRQVERDMRSRLR